MRYFIAMIFFVPLFAAAQDTLIFRDKSKKMLVTILYTTTEEVVYKKMKDRVDRSFVIPMARLKAIAFRDSTVQNFEHINREDGVSTFHPDKADTSYENRVMSISHEPNPQMYERGIIDAKQYYTFYEFFTGKTGSANAIILAGIGGSMTGFQTNDRPIDFPDINLIKYQDYRRGYLDKVRRLKWKYRFAVAGAVVTVGGLFIVFNKFG